MALAPILDEFGRETAMLDDGTTVPCPYCGRRRTVPLIPVGRSGRLVRFMAKPCSCDGWVGASTPPIVREVERKPRALDVPSVFEGGLPDASGIVARLDAGRSVYLVGNFGSGKTATAWSVAKSFHDRGKRVEVAHLADVAASLSAARSFNTEEDEEEVFGRFAGSDLLVLDDVGKERPTEALVVLLWRLVDFRWAHGLPTVFTSNHKPASLFERMAVADLVTVGAIESRILSMCDVVSMVGPDMRRAS